MVAVFLSWSRFLPAEPAARPEETLPADTGNQAAEQEEEAPQEDDGDDKATSEAPSEVPSTASQACRQFMQHRTAQLEYEKRCARCAVRDGQWATIRPQTELTGTWPGGIWRGAPPPAPPPLHQLQQTITRRFDGTIVETCSTVSDGPGIGPTATLQQQAMPAPLALPPVAPPAQPVPQPAPQPARSSTWRPGDWEPWSGSQWNNDR